ncbi:MAG: outer membrane protein assembly factor BamD, partial [Balneolaceae bacterium]
MLLVLSSCSNQELIRPGDSLEEAFEKAYTQFENERWVQAADAFSTVVESGRGTAIGQEAQYYLAESYFRYERYLSAAAEFERYSSLYIDSPRREEVDFKIALSYYHL